MGIELVVCRDLHKGIGADGSMPWPKLPSDMKHFRSITIGKRCVAGYKTYHELKNLPGRTWINFSEEIPETNIVVVGGVSVYDFYAPIADIVWVTQIHNKVYKCDRFFDFYEDDFDIENISMHIENSICYTIRKYTRK